jgi:hypothetical protein
MCSNGLSKSWNIDITKVAFLDVQKTDYEFSGPFAFLKRHLSVFIQVAFFDAQNAENEFVWPFDTFKLRFINFTKFVLFAYLKYHLNDFDQVAFFDVPDSENRFIDITKIEFTNFGKQISISQGLSPT